MGCGKIETLPQPRRLNCPILPLPIILRQNSRRNPNSINHRHFSTQSSQSTQLRGRDYNQQLCAAHMLVTIVPSLPLHRVGG